MHTISVINLKGGTGKTITTLSMAAELHSRGYRVLLVDADPQHNSSSFFRCDNPHWTLADVVTQEGVGPEDVIVHSAFKGLDLVPSDMGLVYLDVRSAVDDKYVSYEFRRFLSIISGRYDICLIDCPPSFTAASIAALLAADEAIIPLKIDAFGLSGLKEIRTQIESVARINGKLTETVLLTIWRKTPAQVQGEELLRSSRIRLWKTHIRYSPKVDECTFTKEFLKMHSPTCAASVDYAAFVDEWEARNPGVKGGVQHG